LIGLVILARELSNRLYPHADRPAFQSSIYWNDDGSGFTLPDQDGEARLTTDKRLHWRPFFAILTPVFYLRYFAGPIPPAAGVPYYPVLSFQQCPVSPRGPPAGLARTI